MYRDSTNKYEVLIAGAKVHFFILLLFLHVFLFLCFCIFKNLFCVFSLFVNLYLEPRLYFLYFLYFCIFVFVRTVHMNFHAKSELCSLKNERVMFILVFGSIPSRPLPCRASYDQPMYRAVSAKNDLKKQGASFISLCELVRTQMELNIVYS